MRQKIEIIALLVIVILAPLQATGLIATYSSNRTLKLELNNQSVRYQIEIQRAKDGRYLLKAPPFLQADISNTLHIGEIQPQGLFSRLINPMRGKSVTVGFAKGTSVSRNYTPSLEPKLSGFNLNGENIELITLSPLLNPNSPTGIGAIVGDHKAYAALLVATQNSVLIRRNITGFQVNWKELGYGQHMLFYLLGTTANSTLGKIRLKGGAFVQGAYDLRLGGGNTTAVGLEAQLTNLKLSFEQRLGGVGVKLTQLEEKANAQKLTKFSFSFNSWATIFGIYESTLYSKPIYGGNSQERTIEYTVGLELKKFELSSTHRTSYEADKGKVSSTLLATKATICNVALALSTQIYRTLKGPCEVHNTCFELKDNHCELEIKNNKIKLKLTWMLTITNAKLELSIDQNRSLIAQLEFKQ